MQNLTFLTFGLGVSIENAASGHGYRKRSGTHVENISRKVKKGCLISVDEVTNSEYIRIFASSFQIFYETTIPSFLLMTGLYENIYNLQNDKVLTLFIPCTQINPGATQLYRYPQTIYGYLFSGYRCCRRTGFTDQRLSFCHFRYLVISTGKIAIKRLWNRFCQNMTNIWMNMYTVKIWSELSDLDQKKIVTEMSLSGETQVKSSP